MTLPGKTTAPVLRQWREADLDPLSEMSADADVMRYFLAPLTREETRAMLDRMRSAIDQRGWGIWAVEVDGDLAGMVGLAVPRWPLPCSPCTEVLWRLRKEYWGRGIAFAAASQACEYGFETVGLDEVVAFTTPPNVRSIRLMERLGFTRDHAGDFDHPAVPEGHPLRRHVLYRKKRPGAVGRREVKVSVGRPMGRGRFKKVANCWVQLTRDPPLGVLEIDIDPSRLQL